MDSITGDRVKISLVIGYGHTDWHEDEFLYALEEQITQHFGGCRVESKRGLWRSDGNGSFPHTGELFEEDSVEFTILTDLPVEQATDMVEFSTRQAAELTGGQVPIEWVNVEVTQAQAHHFKM